MIFGGKLKKKRNAEPEEAEEVQESAKTAQKPAAPAKKAKAKAPKEDHSDYDQIAQSLLSTIAADTSIPTAPRPQPVQEEAASGDEGSIWDVVEEDDADMTVLAAMASSDTDVEEDNQPHEIWGAPVDDDEEFEDVAPPGALAPPAQSASPSLEGLPVGWLVVIEGPGMGSQVTLTEGVARIGRGADQDVRLDFGDEKIAQDTHASIVFDEENSAFFVGPGGKSNMVRLNNKPILGTETVQHGDRIRLGKTTLALVALCDENFSWSR
ncbi:MAG: FHA domain-containing protein [Rhodobacteraceae bacterium]|nr:FHA domain-containing protein [Paracoccaceae bacterium]